MKLKLTSEQTSDLPFPLGCEYLLFDIQNYCIFILLVHHMNMMCTKNVVLLSNTHSLSALTSHIYIIVSFALLIDIQFYIGPVWYNFPTQQSVNVDNNANNSSGNKNNEPPILKRGIVDSVSLDFVTRDMVYNIIYKDHNNDDANAIIIDEVAEKELYYGSSCPVTIAVGGGGGGGEDHDGNSSSSEEGHQDGTVLYCEQSSEDPSKIVYTVMYNEGTSSQARYVENINAECVKYRTPSTNNMEEAEGEVVQKQDVVDDNQKKTLEAAAVPLSITCESTASHPNKKMKHSPLHSIGGGSSSKQHSVGGSTTRGSERGSGRMNTVSIANQWH